jgi:hypothetical protein
MQQEIALGLEPGVGLLKRLRGAVGHPCGENEL